MFKILDRMLARFVPTVTVSAGCSVTRTCTDCPRPSQKARWVTRTCCLNEGCSYSYGSCGAC